MMLARLAQRLPFYYGWLVVAVVFVTMGIGVNARTAFSLLYPPILEEFGWERGVTAGVFSFGFFLSALLSPLFGRMMDSRGPRTVTLIGIGAIAAGLVLAGWWSREPWHFYLTLGGLVGAGSVCLGYSCQALFLPAWFMRRRGLAMSIAFAGVGVGSIVLLPLLQTLIERFGWRTACIALGLFALLLLTPLALLLRRRPEDIGLQPDGRTGTEGAAADARRAYVVDHSWVAVEWTLGRAMRTGRFWWLALGYFLGLFSWYLVQVHQTKYLVEVGFSASDAAWALGWVSFAGVPGQIALGQLSDRVGREIVWTIGSSGFLLTYFALLLLPGMPTMPLLVFMVLAQGLLGYGVTSVFGAIPAEIFEGKHYGSIFGMLMLVAISGGAVGPWVAGVIHDQSGSYAVAFCIAIAASLVSVLAIWMAAPRRVRAVAGKVANAAA
jgi:MFS family permease